MLFGFILAILLTLKKIILRRSNERFYNLKQWKAIDF